MKTQTIISTRIPTIMGFYRAKGFALVVTLSLMILLTVIAVGLLSLSSISLRRSGLESNLAIARANARLGVMMALNQLQSTLGPDQRISATADLKTPVGFSKWTGVYGNQEVADYTQKPSAIPSNPYKPVLLNWLVSGNQSVSYGSSTSSGNFGTITTPPSSFPFQPTDSTTGIGSNSGALTINGQKAAWLVSEGSVGDPVTARTHVAAPIVEIVDAKSSSVRGGYAYWVGDEGTKARIDMRENFRQQTTASKIDEGKVYSLATAQRFGIEMMRADSSSSSKIGDAYNPASKDIEKLATTGEFPLLSATTATAAKARFHDITAYSKSVIADSYAGGLKQDMGALIYGGVGPSGSEPLFVSEAADEVGIPTWGQLRSWAKLTAPLANPPPVMPSSAVQPYTATQARFGPVLSEAVLAFGVEKIPGTTDKLRILLFPAVILWNPYTVGIPASTYEIGYGFKPGNAANDQLNVQLGNTQTGSFTTVGTCNFSGGDATMTPGNGFFRFLIQGSEIPAGESHIYLAESPTSLYTPGASKLVRAPSTAPIGYNTRSFRTDTSFTYNPSTFPNPFVKLDTLLGSSPGMSAGDLREVVLTTPGSLNSGFGPNTPVFQALLDMNVWRTTMPMSTPMPIATAGLQPMVVSRIQLMMESRGGFSADWRLTGAMSQAGASRGQERNRWLATHNPLAPYIKRTQTERDMRGGAFSHGSVLSGENNNNRVMLGITNPANHLAGIGGDQSSGVDGPLIDILASNSPLMSLGQFQHAQFDNYGFGTTYTFGNSGANVNIPRTQHFKTGQVARPGNSPTNYQDPIYDVSWHVNRALWDRYFVSTAPASLTQAEIDTNQPLPNARMTYVDHGRRKPLSDELRPNNPDTLEESAANLMVNGGFNINSTSIDAWRALLTGTNKLNAPSTLANPTYATTPLNAMMPRFSRDVRKTNAYNSDGVLNMWGDSADRFNVYRGNRELALFREAGKTSETATQAQDRLHEVAGELATKIVSEIRVRGPFLSLGDFINRKLTDDDQGIRGTLQAAIDKMSSNQVNPVNSFNQIGAFVDTAGNNKTISAWDGEHFMGTPASESGSSNSRTAMAPKHLTQADILSTIGPALSARSDTFIIRGYGEALDPATKTPTAKAWCEVVVQRIPEYIDQEDSASTAPKDLTKTINKTLGRRFDIVSFRWLDSSEI